jgi:putative ABC transport system substrate-binding protein
MRRREFIALIASAAVSLPALAQKTSPRIGWLVFGDATLGPADLALKEALAHIGLADGHAVQVVYRYANGNAARLDDLADDLVAQKPDLLLGLGGDVLKSLHNASKGKIPVVGGDKR